MHRALRIRVVGWACTRRRQVVLLSLVVATIVAAVLSIAAGAHRTDTAPDRYATALGNDVDLRIEQEEGRPVADEVATLPAVRHVEAFTFIFVAGIGADGAPLDAISFTGTIGGAEARLVDGRNTDPSRREEFVSTPSFLASSGLEIGDTIDTISLTFDDIQQYGFDVARATGPVFRATLVGVIDGPSELEEPTPIMLFSPALLADDQIAIASTTMTVALADGATSDDLRAELDQSMPDNAFDITPATTLSEEIRSSVRAQAIGLWLLAGASAIAGVAAVGHLLARTVLLTPDDERSLRSLGYTRPMLIAESAARAVLIVVISLVPAVALATWVSGLFPFAFPGRVEPSPGRRFDASVLLPGALVLGLAAVLWVTVVALSRRRPTRAAEPGAVEVIATRSPSATFSTGLRSAFTSGGGGTTSLAATVGGTTAIFAAVIGTLTFALSLEQLVEQGELHGDNYDVMMDNGAEEIRSDLRRYLTDDPGVAAVELYRSGQARVADDVLPVIAGESLRGELDPVVLSGRLPSGANEIALGGVSARRHGVGIGDTITLTTAATTASFEITGLVIPPGIRGFDLLGQGSVLHRNGFERLFPDAVARSATVRFVDGPERLPAYLRMAEAFGMSPDEAELQRPPTIVTLGRVTFVPYALAGVLVGLGAVVLTASLWTGVRRRDHQAAVLRSLGAVRGWLIVSVWWHAVLFTLVPAAIGAAAGLIAGRLVYRTYAERRGVVPDMATPWAAGSAAIAALLLLGITVATIAGRRARRGHPASLLRTG